MISEVFKRNEEKLKLLIIIDKIQRKIYLFCMDDVIKFVIEDAENNVGFTKKGIIKLGRFVTIQRKGGDSVTIKIPKTDWKHPGNQLQFKFSPLKFAQSVESEQAIKFCVINY
jgi:coenzyme F420-reducing hydrogenase beta subunit